MAPSAEIMLDGSAYGGFVEILRNVLEELGVHPEQLRYIYHGEQGPCQ